MFTALSIASAQLINERILASYLAPKGGFVGAFNGDFVGELGNHYLGAVDGVGFGLVGGVLVTPYQQAKHWVEQ